MAFNATSATAADAWTRARALGRRLQQPILRRELRSALGSVSLLRGVALEKAVSRLSAMPLAAPDQVQELAALLATVAEWMLVCGALASSDEFWGLTEDTVSAFVSGAPPRESLRERARVGRQLALRRWEPLIYSAIMGTGSQVPGEPVSGGSGAGIGVFIRGFPTEPTSSCALY